MIDINSILQNETVKGLLAKAGVDEKQAQSIAKTAMDTIQSKFKNNPGAMSSLLSSNPNTEADEKLKGEVESDFVSQLITKAGLSEGTANQIKGAIPDILSQITGSLNSAGKNNQDGIAGMLGGIVDMFDGDNSKGGKKSGGGILGMLKGLFGGK